MFSKCSNVPNRFFITITNRIIAVFMPVTSILAWSKMALASKERRATYIFSGCVSTLNEEPAMVGDEEVVQLG
jgi:hypothetical protein